MKKNMKQKQKLDRRDTCTPMDAPQVRGSVILSLNRDHSLSEQDLKTLSNNPDVDPPQPAGGHEAVMQVFILNRNGKKKMDVSMKKVRLVRYGKGLQFQSRFLPILTGGVSSGGIR